MLVLRCTDVMSGFTQELPQADNRSVSILDAALQRTLGALSRRRGYLLPKGAASEVITKKADLWTALTHELA